MGDDSTKREDGRDSEAMPGHIGELPGRQPQFQRCLSLNACLVIKKVCVVGESTTYTLIREVTTVSPVGSHGRSA